ncbi:ribonuclease Z [Mechercharimyces sp. CAU 1602]|uniref:ribonuclease Z n=1 Tax=Mechercharimyces sp. CAU 1602 TaxID=2973933 RepID=UPI002163538E|nr:ribonuclease Z [Mechercharimyces sp. CAU 1602]MCS1350526.1 ribonuclease Z [Mechercharimyces sp. CAU 1602]
MELTFLGTGAGIPAKERNVSALALRMPEYEGQTWLFDCGEATQHQILHTSLKLSKINRIFITHLHGDHIFGLPGVLGSRSFQGATSPLTLYGPAGIRKFVEAALQTSQTYLRYPLNIIQYDEETEWELDSFHIRAQKLEHGLLSYGFRIEEHDQPGKLDVQRLKELEVPPGPLYSQLKRGESVRLPNGRLLCSESVVGPAKKGRVLAIFGDTRPTETAATLAHSADVLVHEATFGMTEVNTAYQHYHTTAQQAALFAKGCQVKRLLLTHISPRYQEDCAALLQEAKDVFPHTHLAHDLWSYTF